MTLSVSQRVEIKRKLSSDEWDLCHSDKKAARRYQEKCDEARETIAQLTIEKDTANVALNAVIDSCKELRDSLQKSVAVVDKKLAAIGHLV